MNPSDIALATITLVRSDAEAQLLRRSLQLLAGTGMPIAVADAGTDARFSGFLAGLPDVVVERPRGSGLVAQVHASIAAAERTERRFLLYTEPDKEQFFARHLSRFVDDATDDEQAGIVVAARSQSSLETFPPMQRYVESIVNRLCGEMVGVRGDYSYGPFIMTRALAADVARAPLHLGWGWRPFTFVAAHRRGLRISHVVGDFDCPPDQTGEDADERAHRLRQLRDNIAGLLA